jgi:hypothetical protein
MVKPIIIIKVMCTVLLASGFFAVGAIVLIYPKGNVRGHDRKERPWDSSGNVLIFHCASGSQNRWLQ